VGTGLAPYQSLVCPTHRALTVHGVQLASELAGCLLTYLGRPVRHPFVAFLLSQGLARTRDEAAMRRPEFESWMEDKYEDIQAEDLIDPQYFLKWERSLRVASKASTARRHPLAQLTGTDGSRGSYSVLPIPRSDKIHWIDASTFELATTATIDVDQSPCRDDFELQVTEWRWQVRRVFHSK
jgi:hypothetical protein